ncbi:MAG: hypothetical protein A4E28_01715 [Methanocella sp. PtaU1.Bin125]|nr:MAG: hypothetical protein A4E28_01715 [Methanocella sp. PtaU1.Bin125]
MTGRYRLAIIAVAVILLAATPATAAAPGEPGVHITKMSIEPDGPDFNVTVSYSSSFMTRIFSLLFGARVVEPAIVEQVSVLGNVSLVSIDTSAQTAKLVARDQGHLSGGMFVYDKNSKFLVPVDTLEIKGRTVDRPITQNNTIGIPTFFYRP